MNKQKSSKYAADLTETGSKFMFDKAHSLWNRRLHAKKGTRLLISVQVAQWNNKDDGKVTHFGRSAFSRVAKISHKRPARLQREFQAKNWIFCGHNYWTNIHIRFSASVGIAYGSFQNKNYQKTFWNLELVKRLWENRWNRLESISKVGQDEDVTGSLGFFFSGGGNDSCFQTWSVDANQRRPELQKTCNAKLSWCDQAKSIMIFYVRRSMHLWNTKWTRRIAVERPQQ